MGRNIHQFGNPETGFVAGLATLADPNVVGIGGY
jgi:hypothetical protein